MVYFNAGTHNWPFFFNEEGKAVTVNGEWYHSVLKDFFIPQVEDIDKRTSTSNKMERRVTPGRLISRFGDVEWPARCPDLSPLDFFLWGHLMEKLYRYNPQTELKKKLSARR